MSIEEVGLFCHSVAVFLLGIFPNRAGWIFLGGGISACALLGFGLNGKIIERGFLLFFGALLCMIFWSAKIAPLEDWDNFYLEWSFFEDVSRWMLLLQGCSLLAAGGHWMLWALFSLALLVMSFLIRRP